MRRYGLIGRPLGHSASAAYFAAKFEREGIADCAYALYELPDIGALEGLLARTPDLCGFNVTIPYKREVMPLLDALSHDARMIGAVNCVRRAADGSLTGHNTDVVGLRASLDELLGGEQPEHALVLGTGGASQAVQYVLAERGIPFDLRSRGAEPSDRQRFARGDLPRRRCRAADSLRLRDARTLSVGSGIQPAPDAVPRLRTSARGAYSQRRNDAARTGRGLVADLERMTLKNNSSMKRMAICLSALAVWCGAAAQETVPPRFQGSDAKRFMARLIGETEKIVDAAQIPAAELSSQVVVGFTVDETGNVTQWRFLDRTCAGKDSVGVEPATPRTREAMTEALGRLEKWTPAMKDGKPTTYSWRLTMRLPVEKIAKKQDADPLLFLGGDPDKTFHEWASLRLRYDGRFTGRGAKGEGVVRVRFYIEPDGKITIGEVIKSPDEKLSREMIRVIRSSKGKWTPRKVRGVPQRTAYEYGVNFLGMAE